MLPRKTQRCPSCSRNPSHAADPRPNRNTHAGAPTDYRRSVFASSTPDGPSPADTNPGAHPSPNTRADSRTDAPAHAHPYPCAHAETNSAPHSRTHTHPNPDACADLRTDAPTHAPLHPQSRA